MKFKGYTALITIDEEANVLSGRIDGVQDVVTFEAESLALLKKEFEASVDDYLEFCKSRGESPEKPHSGRFVLRLSPAVHKRAAEAARSADMSLNGYIAHAVERQLDVGTAVGVESRRSRGKFGAKVTI